MGTIPLDGGIDDETISVGSSNTSIGELENEGHDEINGIDNNNDNDDVVVISSSIRDINHNNHVRLA